jgi:transposase
VQQRQPVLDAAARDQRVDRLADRDAWLFSDTVAGANASANLYSLLQTCMANGIDGYPYLHELLVALPRAKTVDDYEALLPWRLTPKRA